MSRETRLDPDEKRLNLCFSQSKSGFWWAPPDWCAWLLTVTLIVTGLLQLPSGNAAAGDKEPDECGLASIYSGVSEETASGEDTRAEDLTAAHRSLPFGTLVQVDNRENGQSAVVRITDRGPFVRGRVIDVSQLQHASSAFPV
jgi:hypothetical protein